MDKITKTTEEKDEMQLNENGKLIKEVLDKLNESVDKVNTHDTKVDKQTVSNFDNISFEIDKKFTSLIIKITSGKTTKTTTLGLK